MLDATIAVQAICLLAATSNLVVMNLWLAIHVDRLSNVRYVPGIVLLLSTYAYPQLEFVGPPRLARLWMKRLGILLGIVSEAAWGPAFSGDSSVGETLNGGHAFCISPVKKSGVIGLAPNPGPRRRSFVNPRN